MRKGLKDKRAVDNLAKLLAMVNGPSAPEIDVEVVTRDAATYRPDPSYAADAVIKFIEKPARFAFKECARLECKEMFGTNYRAVDFCSVNCRMRYLADLGIKWNPYKKEEERWGGEPPLIIPPEALKVLLKLAQIQNETPPSPLQEPALEIPDTPPVFEFPIELPQPTVASHEYTDLLESLPLEPLKDHAEIDPFADLF